MSGKAVRSCSCLTLQVDADPAGRLSAAVNCGEIPAKVAKSRWKRVEFRSVRIAGFEKNDVGGNQLVIVERTARAAAASARCLFSSGKT